MRRVRLHDEARNQDSHARRPAGTAGAGGHDIRSRFQESLLKDLLADLDLAARRLADFRQLCPGQQRIAAHGSARTNGL